MKADREVCHGVRNNGRMCRRQGETRRVKVFGDAEIYNGLWVEVWLCESCIRDFRIRTKPPNAPLTGAGHKTK